MTDEQLEARALRQGVESRIRRLRLLIDRIEEDSLLAIDRAEQGQGRYCGAAEVFVKGLPEGIVNVGIDQLVFYAAGADVLHAAEAARKNEEG
jgi:hypothetical protein